MTPPLFPQLLGPLQEREKPYLDSTVHKQEDLAFVDALLRVLEQDLARGAIPTREQAQAWAEYLTWQLHPPRAVAKVSVLDRVDLPLPGQPWPDQGADPRETLLAKLVHLGADPWQRIEQTGNGLHASKSPGDPNEGARFLGGHLAGTWLMYGYSNLTRLAMQLPHAREDYLVKGPHRSYEQGHLSMHQQAAASDDLAALDQMLNTGASVEGVLPHARSVAVVERLLAAGAKPDADTVVKHWLKKLDAKTARALIQATEQHMSPTTRLGHALAGKTWGAVNDALGAWEGWQTATLPLGQARLRVAAHSLAGCTRQHGARVQHALRLLDRQAPTMEEVVPGLSEVTLVRLCLHALAHPQHTNGLDTKEEKALTQKLSTVLSTLGGTPAALEQDIQDFLRAASHFHGTTCAFQVAETALRTSLLLPGEKGGNAGLLYSRRSAEDMLTLGQAARCLWEQKSRYGSDSPYFNKLFGMTPDGLARAGYGGTAGNDPRKTWFPQMLRKHPEQHEALTMAALHLLGAGIGHTIHSRVQGDPWAVLCQQIDQAISEGGLHGLSHADARVLGTLAKDCQASPAVQVFGAQLQSKVEQLTLDTATPQASSASARPRF